MTPNTTINDTTVWSNPVVFGFRRMFYVCTPGETSFPDKGDVPDYVNQAVPFFLVFVLMETVVLMRKGKWMTSMPGHDSFSSVAAGTISLFPMLFVRHFEMAAYIWTYEHFHLFTLPWDSAATWWLCMMGVDFLYYWVHRCCHEVNFLWAAHQVHHSSECYNLTTALRQPLLQKYTSWIFYLPMAVCIPPSVFMVHLQFNLIYQFWVHTECIKRLGPLEWILNTPSHHRVHHGRNRYCIDSNYGGTLIIWDRIFGTFSAEDDNDPVTYGLVHPLASWDPIYTQFSHCIHMAKTFWKLPGLSNKISVFIKGPGWEPNKPRLGYMTDIPDIHAPQPKYDKYLPPWMDAYTFVHFVLVLLAHEVVIAKKAEHPVMTVFLAMLYLLWTMSNIGFIYEHKWYAPTMEFLRCIIYLALDASYCSGDTCHPITAYIRWIFMISTIMCLVIQTRGFHFEQDKKVQ